MTYTPKQQLQRVTYTALAIVALSSPSAVFAGGPADDDCHGVCTEDQADWNESYQCFYFLEEPCDYYDLDSIWGQME